MTERARLLQWLNARTGVLVSAAITTENGEPIAVLQGHLVGAADGEPLRFALYDGHPPDAFGPTGFSVPELPRDIRIRGELYASFVWPGADVAVRISVFSPRQRAEPPRQP